MNTATNGNWNVRASKVTLRDNIGPETNIASNVVFRIETIVSGYGIPSAQLNVIATQLGATKNPITKLYTVSCEHPKFLSLTIANKIYQIPSFNYIISNGVSPSCTLNFFESNDWILGQAFFALYDIVFDASARRIGFA